MESAGTWQEWTFVIGYVSFIVFVAGCVIVFSSRN